MLLSKQRIILVAGDDGPKSALRPLLDALPVVPASNYLRKNTGNSDWLDLFRLHAACGMVCGTSDSLAGRALESSARRAAACAHLPVIAVEDFPGNYYDVPDGHVNLLVVESNSVESITYDKFGNLCPPIKVLSPARYDPLRNAAPSARTIICNAIRQQNGRHSVLWAGQPETNDCLITLKNVLPELKAQCLDLLFKAHPRDAGYQAGAYRTLLEDSGLPYRDVTHLSVEASLLFAPLLVITQFSSTAIEAGFFGIPSVNLLFPEAGGARLREKKGYDVPPHCCGGAAVHVRHPSEFRSTLTRATQNNDFRKSLICCFDTYFSTCEPALPRFVALIKNLFQNKGFTA